MGTVRKTITLTEQQDAWIKAQLLAGDFTNDSEYLRDLIRREQERNDKFSALKAAIEEGMNSGINEKTIPEIMSAVKSRMHKDDHI